MKKILCPTDFSETAHNAIAYAAKLAQLTGSQLTLLNVQSLYEITPVDLTGGKFRRAEAAAEELDAQSREISKVFKVSCYPETEATARKLSAVIADKGQYYDLIVMGSDGPDDFFQFLTGSNTYNTVLKSRTPLLMIPRDYFYSEIKKMVFAFDYFHIKSLPLDNLIPFVKAVNCELTILQVLDEPFTKEVDEHLKEIQPTLATSIKNDIRVRYEPIQSKDVAESIKHYVRENRSDVLALCATTRNFFSRLLHKSVIRQVTADTRYPILIFHE